MATAQPDLTENAPPPLDVAARLRSIASKCEASAQRLPPTETLEILLSQMEAALSVAAQPPLFASKEDRYGGVEIVINDAAATVPHALGAALGTAIDEWKAAGKRGLWLKIPIECASCVGCVAALGFAFHHAKPAYVEMTRWLPAEPSPLPAYAFTQIGVGGVVVNAKGEVLMVQEKVSPIASMQGSWKLPGGLAEPGEDFAQTVAREVKEETGVTASLANGGGLVSLRHSHAFRFGMGDLYAVVKLVCEGSDALTIDANELAGARWIAPEEIRALVTPSSAPSLNGKVSENNMKMVDAALSGALIRGTALQSSRPGVTSMFYTAPPPPDPVGGRL